MSILWDISRACLYEKRGAIVPKVSVIIPCYNQEKYLETCLNSVLSQSLSDIEVLCVDDGSTDGTGDILAQYAARDDRLHLLSQKNKGASFCRNRAIDQARGEYLIFCDSDDIYPDTAIIERLYCAGVEHDAKAVAGSYSIFNETDNEVRYDFDGLLWGQSFKREGFVSFLDYQFDYGFTRFMFRSREIKNSGIRFAPYSRFEDPPFLVALLGYLEMFYAIPDVVYQARVGYKQVVWDSSAQVDLLKGLSDNLRYSRIHRLKNLHELTVRRIEEEYAGVFYWSLIDEMVFSAIVRANGEVSPELLSSSFQGRVVDGFLLLKPMEQQVANAQKWNKDIQDLHGAVLAERADKENAWERLKDAGRELAAVYDSTTWRIGSVFTAVPRWFRDFGRKV